jgi:hypothetical protein
MGIREQHRPLGKGDVTCQQSLGLPIAQSINRGQVLNAAFMTGCSGSSLMADDPLLAVISSRLKQLGSAAGGVLGPTAVASAHSSGGERPALGADVEKHVVGFSELAFKRQIGSGSFGRVSWPGLGRLLTRISSNYIAAHAAGNPMTCLQGSAR